MKKPNFRAAWHKAAAVRTSRYGLWSAGITALAVAVAITVNLLVGQLPETWTQFDMSGSGIYDITDTSRDYLADLTEDVEIHVLASEESLDTRITRFLSLYQDLSDHLTVEYTDPNVFPSVLTTYGVDANTIVVTCEATGRQESFSIDEIIGYDIMSYYMYGVQSETDFDAEGLLTSAVDLVLRGTTRTLYQLEGHQETALPDTVTEQLDKAHLAVESLNLLTAGAVPEACDVLVINAPAGTSPKTRSPPCRSILPAGDRWCACSPTCPSPTWRGCWPSTASPWQRAWWRTPSASTRTTPTPSSPSSTPAWTSPPT